jgi:hypothetical protein
LVSGFSEKKVSIIIHSCSKHEDRYLAIVFALNFNAAAERQANQALRQSKSNIEEEGV